jgi:hypothetical protein
MGNSQRPVIGVPLLVAGIVLALYGTRVYRFSLA